MKQRSGQVRAKAILARIAAVLCLLISVAGVAKSQPKIVTVRPDEAAPAMTIVVEVLAPAIDRGVFGQDGLTPSGTSVKLIDPADSERVMIGPLVVSWTGRLVQIPILVSSAARLGSVRFQIVSPSGSSNIDSVTIVQPEHFGVLSGSVELNHLSRFNTLVVDSLILTDATVSVGTSPIGTDGNSRLQPLTILSSGPIRLLNSMVSVDADSLDGGPGGGGGGHGHSGVGGQGFTGGGNSSVAPEGNQGSATGAVDTAGGANFTGIYGGGSENSDQGGGGGTGAPFGTSGRAGIGSDTSRRGGYGGGSGGGELAPQVRAYGGGGGAFGINAQRGGGIGSNQGMRNGGRFLIPLAGGSGGGSGNALNEEPDAGSGGGGGGAIALVSFDSVVIDQSTISARGDSGTSGGILTAAGGGGSGGGIYVGSQKGGRGNEFELATEGGSGGNGGLNGLPGGAGSVGRFRIDGSFSDDCPQCHFSGIQAAGISVLPVTGIVTKSYVKLSGYAEDPGNTTDSIRIFYRTHHSDWQYFDTVRYKSGAHRVWSKWLPLGHDSLVYVVAMIQVSAPDTGVANKEPNWLVSHISQVTIHHVASPNLVALDTVRFDTTTVGHCRTKWLFYSNNGEAPLRIDSVLRTGSDNFTLLTPLPKTIAPYRTDSLEIEFCPDTLGEKLAVLNVFANDTARREIILVGSGASRNDSLAIVPNPVNLGRVLVGDCDTVFVKLFSKGRDTVYLAATNFSVPPFELSISQNDSAISPGDSATLQVVFCPVDTGLFGVRVPLDSKGNAVMVSGRGISRALAISGPLNLGTFCQGQQIALSDTIRNIGTDTIGVEAFSNDTGVRLVSPLPKNLLQGGEQIIYVWSLASTTPQHYSDTLYYLTNDTLLSRIVTYDVREPMLNTDSALDFHFVCVGTCDTASLFVQNVGADTLSILLPTLTQGMTYELALRPFLIAPTTRDSFQIVCCPSTAAMNLDTVQFIARIGNCDSLYRIPISSIGTISPLVIGNLNFDTTLVGECIEDSLLIENPCGPAVTLSKAILPSFVSIAPDELPIQIDAKNRAYLHLSFCPKSVGDSASTATFTLGTAEYSDTISGVAIDSIIARHDAYFSLSKIAIIAGQTDETVLRLDSSTLTGMHSFTATIVSNPDVAMPTVSKPFAGTEAIPGTFTISGVIDFDRRGPIDTISWLGFLGSARSTELSLALTTDTTTFIHNSSGRIDIVDCSSLAGKIVLAGEYKMRVNPPTAGSLSAEITVGNDGPVSVDLWSITGQKVREILNKNLSRGDYLLSAPTAGLGSGVYIVRMETLGFVQSQMIGISH